MSEIGKIRAVLDSQEFKKRFRDNLVEEARQTRTALHYVDAKGRYVEEWPVTGELYEVRYDALTDQPIRLQALHKSDPVAI